MTCIKFSILFIRGLFIGLCRALPPTERLTAVLLAQRVCILGEDTAAADWPGHPDSHAREEDVPAGRRKLICASCLHMLSSSIM